MMDGEEGAALLQAAKSISVTHPCSVCAVLTVRGSLGLHISAELKQVALDEVADGRRRLVVVLDDLETLDTKAVSALMTIHANTRKEAHMAVVCSLDRHLHILQMTGLDRSIPVLSSVHEALSHLRGHWRHMDGNDGDGCAQEQVRLLG